ncbi:MAG: tetratricopeptide repeat protein [Alistipes sp.]|jgi:Flp pilus assembly protein TadD/outer membrane protein OmpA-like peptidoglycan-associated protein|nr:tetratricopeptide repeat protein [Alistipes sp.]
MKNVFRLMAIVAVASLSLTSCNCFKKMAKNQDEVKVTCTPDVLTLNNGKVEADITVVFPAEYYNKKAVLKVTPIMVFEGGIVEGATKYFQGGKVKENYTVIDKKLGGEYTQHVEFPYDARMAQSELKVLVEVKCPKGKCKDYTLVNANTGALPTKAEKAALAAGGAQAEAVKVEFAYPIAKGVNTLQGDLDYASAMSNTANNYKNVTTVVTKADILYAINSSNVSKKAANSEDLKAFKENVVANQANDRASQKLYVNGYASPDGPEKFNDKLSSARSKSGHKAAQKLLKDTGMELDAASYGEDWEGFKELVAASDIEDKDLILQVLSRYDSSTQRESEIKNMSAVFTELKKEILPKLRRAQLINSTDIKGKTNDEMAALINEGRLEELTNEELLYMAESVLADAKAKVAVLEYTAKKFNDARAYNNLGVVLAQLGDKAKALTAFEKAAQLGLNNNEINSNLALANLANGNVAKAQQFAAAADAKTKSLISAAQGSYSAAAATLEGYNAAIASTLNNDLSAAKKAIAAETTAKADYLRAVIASKEGDLETAKAQLKSAIAKDATLAAKAAKDVNLANLFASGFKL